MFSMTLWLLSILVPLQILLGDLHGSTRLNINPQSSLRSSLHWETASRFH